MATLLTAAQMRALEQAAMESGTVSGKALMERAGAGVVAEVLRHWPELARGTHRAVVLCGPGNNGGDGFVIARLLAVRGWAVEVFLYGDAARLPPDARANLRRWAGVVQDWDGVQIMQAARGGVDLVVDAVFGAGLARPVATGVLEPLAALAAHAARVVAVDSPTGLCMDSGRPLVEAGAPVRADLTVTFHAARPGHYLEVGPAFCGRVVCVDIGLVGGGDIRLIEAPTGALGKSGTAHKYAHGHALVLAGGPGHGGAARLAARAALRVGAGLVTLACPPEALMENAAQLNAIMLREVADAPALEVVLGDQRMNAICLGPGLGQARARDLVPVALAAGQAGGRAVVLDADALTCYAKHPAELFEITYQNCVLTPHEGEFRRLFPDLFARLAAPPEKGPAYSRVDATREAAARAGSVVLLKGPVTVIAAPDGQVALHAAVYARAAPWLATAGSGDVLAGLITGLLARGFAPMAAAETGAWLHAETARAYGPGLIAEDLPEELPRVFRGLEAQAAQVSKPSA